MVGKKRCNQNKKKDRNKKHDFPVSCRLQRLLEQLIQAQKPTWEKVRQRAHRHQGPHSAKVLGKLVVSSLVGFVTELAGQNATFAHEFTGTDIERQQSLNAVVMSTSSFSNLSQDVLAQRCTELSVLKQLPSRPSHLWRISPPCSTSGRVREQVFCVLNRLGALGNCCSRFNIFSIAGIDAAPFDSSHTAHCVPVPIRVSFGVFRFPAQGDKGRLGHLQHAGRQWHRRWESTFVATCSSHVHIAKPGSLTTSWSAWVLRELSRWFVERCGCY